MSESYGYHNRKKYLCSQIRSLLLSLTTQQSKYEEITPKIEYWIEYVLREEFLTVEELVEGVSYVAWNANSGHFASIGKFLKEFYDAPHRSDQARTFVTRMCTHVLRWFAIASVEGTWDLNWRDGLAVGGPGFIRAASCVGYLIKSGLLSHELVQRHLTKPLTNYYNNDCSTTQSPGAIRASAIYELFTAAGNTLLQGLLEPDDVQACFSLLDTCTLKTRMFDMAKIQEFREIHTAWMEQAEAQRSPGEIKENEVGGGQDMAAAEVETPVAFAPQDLPTASIGIEIPSSILQDIGSVSALHDTDSSSEATLSSPTMSIATVSDLTPTELGEIEQGQEQEASHDTFYFEDGNVEIVGGDSIFRVHSTVVSFSSSKLREILSQSVLLSSPTPEGRPRINVSDNAEDFAMLLKMIYTPGFPPRHEVPEFRVFASLLRMTTKYGFSNIRDQLVKDLEGAYPTRWEDFINARVIGEDIFGSPKPHPNAVLNLFEAQNIKAAIPFATYRASIGGFSALISDQPGTVLSRHTLTTAIHGMHLLQSMAVHAAHMITYGTELWVCPDNGCILGADTSPIKPRMEAIGRIYKALADQRQGGVLSPPCLGHLLCAGCAHRVVAIHASYRKVYWEKLAPVFNVSDCWNDL